MLEIGSLVDGKYKILNKVGQGGMSVVYLAMNEKANKQWAVKEVRKDGVLDFEAVKQGLVAETDILKRLSHPNLPSIIDVIDTDESFIIIMDYIQGNSLNKALEEYGAQPQDKVIEWAKQLCNVLGYLHTRTPPIIYRDMKPANIMLKPDGNVTLIDFGTAREYKEKNLADTTCLGTVGYAAPEQFGGMGQTDARTDIYCLGATLYHLVTGMNPCEPPYEIKPIREINPNLSGGLERIILKCTQRDPNDRYQSAAELMYALEHYEEIDDIYRKKQKKKLVGFLIPAILTLVFTGVAIWGYSSREAELSANYDYQIAVAAQQEDDELAINQYLDAIATAPTRVEAYQAMINRLLKDDELTVEENKRLNQLKIGVDQENNKGFKNTVDVLGALERENSDGYQDVCNEIGEAYLYYYNVGVEKDKYEAASSWFQRAQDKYPAAKLYCDIADCMESISKYESSGQVAKQAEEFQKLWGKIKELCEEARNYGDDDKMHIWREIVEMIDNNPKAFRQVVGEEPLDLLEEIKTGSEAVTNTFLQEKVESLRGYIESVVNKLNEYKETGS